MGIRFVSFTDQWEQWDVAYLSLSGFLKLKSPVISIFYVTYFSEKNAFQNSIFHGV